MQGGNGNHKHASSMTSAGSTGGPPSTASPNCVCQNANSGGTAGQQHGNGSQGNFASYSMLLTILTLKCAFF